MKTTKVLVYIILATLLLTGCSSLFEFIGNGTPIAPSNVIITDTRSMGNFTGIDMRTLGNVILSQGTSESLTIKGSDNIVPLVTSSVQNGILVLELKENVNITTLNSENVLTFTIVVKDLTSLAVSGLGDVEVGSLTTPALSITMSGAGQVKLNLLTAGNADISVSGLGNVELAGQVSLATINIPGAGNVNAPDLKIQTAHVIIPGLGNAVLWVTDSLTGTVSGGGSVSYYGSPQTNINSTGLGVFKALGSK